jgi:WD40 repeat protein
LVVQITRQSIDHMATIELEHAIGYSCNVPRSVLFHPNGTDYVYMSGGCVVIADTRDAHNQEFLRAHDSNITCLDISKSGQMIASGQEGENSDVCVWDFKTRKLLHRLNEHDVAVAAVQFSHDELMILTVGNDKRLLIWDSSTGNIVASSPLPTNSPNTLVAWGGRVRDIKKRETKNYQFATAGNKEIYIWELDPEAGELQKFKVNVAAFTRDYTDLIFSQNGDFLYAGSASGDVSCVIVKNRQLAQPFKACSLGVKSLTRYEENDRTKLIIGGGDGTLNIYAGSGKDYVHEQKLQLVDISNLPTGVSVNSITIAKTSIMAGTSAGDIFLVQFDGTLKGKILLNQNHVGPVLGIDFPTGINDKVNFNSARLTS